MTLQAFSLALTSGASSLVITQGDQVVISLQTLNSGLPVDLTGAVFTTTILGPNQTVVSFADGQHTANPDQINFKGWFTLALSGNNTQSLEIFTGLEVLTKVLIGGSVPNYFRGPAILSVLNSVPTL